MFIPDEMHRLVYLSCNIFKRSVRICGTPEDIELERGFVYFLKTHATQSTHPLTGDQDQCDHLPLRILTSLMGVSAPVFHILVH